MNVPDITDETLKRLTMRAKAANCSIDDLLRDMLDSVETANVPSSIQERLLAHTSDPISLFNRDLRYVYANPILAELSGRDIADIIGKTDRELGMPEKQVRQWQTAWQVVIETRTEKIITFDFVTPYGHRFYESRLTPILDDTGEVEYLSAVTRDITERIQMESALSESRQNLEALIENFDGSVWSIDTNYRLITANARFFQDIKDTLGYAIDADDTLTALSLPKANLHEWQGYYDRGLQGEPFTLEVTTRFSASQSETEYHFNPIRSDSGAVVGLTIFARDITEQKRAEKQLRQSEANLRAMLNSTSQSFTLIDRDYYIVDFDEKGKQASEAIFGKEMHGGASIYDFVFPKDLDGFNENSRRALSGEIITLEKDFQSADGATFVFEFTYYPVADRDGMIIGFCMSNQNITQRKQTQKSLQQSEASLKEAQATAHLGSWELNFQTGVTVWSDELFRIFGFEPGSVEPSTELRFSLIHPDDRDHAVQAFEESLQSGKPYKIDKRIIRPDGEIRWVISEGIVSFDNQHNPLRFTGTFLDITERKQVEEALIQSEARLRSLLETQTAFVVRSDMQGLYTYSNEAFARKYEWLSTHLIGRPLLETVVPQDREKTLATVEQCVAEPGKPVQVVLGKTVAEGEPEFITLWEFVAIQDRDQKVNEIQCIGFDITSQMEAEQIRLEHERLTATLKKEKEFNELTQKVVSALSHDIRIPLTVIATSAEMLDRYFDRYDSEKRKEKLDSIGKQLRYVIEIVDEMVMTVKSNLSSKAFKLTRVNIAALCEISLKEIQQTTGYQHYLRFVNYTHIQAVMVDETLVNRILLNLLSNAVKFSPADSEILLELDQRGNWLILRVVDYGLGIAEGNQEHIFDAFFRADNALPIAGTGLGLSIVQDCVERHNGHISVQSELGQGTTFTVELPLIES